jgi:hypothetical protein
MINARRSGSENVREVIRLTGEGVIRAHAMLERAKGDIYLAAGYCRACGLAVKIGGGPEARAAAEDRLAASYARDFRDKDQGLVEKEVGPAP